MTGAPAGRFDLSPDSSVVGVAARLLRRRVNRGSGGVRMGHWLVIGGGVLGLAVARELVGAGVKVTVLEAKHPGAGTSSTSFAWVNASQKVPESYRRLNVLGMQEYRRIAPP